MLCIGTLSKNNSKDTFILQKHSGNSLVSHLLHPCRLRVHTRVYYVEQMMYSVSTVDRWKYLKASWIRNGLRRHVRTRRWRWQKYIHRTRDILGPCANQPFKVRGVAGCIWPNSAFWILQIIGSVISSTSSAMAPGLVDTTMPYVDGASRQETGRPQDTWGTPLPTRKLSPQDDVAFDSSLQPRAHKMDSMEARLQVADRMLIYNHSEFCWFQGFVSECPDVSRIMNRIFSICITNIHI